MIYDNIKAVCDKKKTTIAEVERRAGLSKGSICKWKTSSPTVDNLKSVAKALRVDIKKLID